MLQKEHPVATAPLPTQSRPLAWMFSVSLSARITRVVLPTIHWCPTSDSIVYTTAAQSGGLYLHVFTALGMFLSTVI